MLNWLYICSNVYLFDGLRVYTHCVTINQTVKFIASHWRREVWTMVQAWVKGSHCVSGLFSQKFQNTCLLVTCYTECFKQQEIRRTRQKTNCLKLKSLKATHTKNTKTQSSKQVTSEHAQLKSRPQIIWLFPTGSLKSFFEICSLYIRGRTLKLPGIKNH